MGAWWHVACRNVSHIQPPPDPVPYMSFPCKCLRNAPTASKIVLDTYPCVTESSLSYILTSAKLLSGRRTTGIKEENNSHAAI